MTMFVAALVGEGVSITTTPETPTSGDAMTSSFTQPQPVRRGPSPTVAIVVGVIAVIAVFTLLMAGITFFGLAIAFPIAVPIAEAYHLPIRAADAALAERFAAYWWVFAALALASFVGAAVTAVKAIQALSPGD